MDADGKTHQEGNQDDPAVGMGLVRVFIPRAHGPENQGRKQGRHRIDLPLDRREPEGVGETVGKGAHRPAPEDRDGLGHAVLPVPARLDQPLGEEDDGEIQQENRQRGKDGIHRIDRHGRMVRIDEHGGETRKQLEHRVSRRVAHFQFIGRGDEFSTVPERRGRLDGRKVRHRSDGEHHP